MIKKCKWCGDNFDRIKGAQKYCEDCRKLPKDLLSGKVFDNRKIQVCKYCNNEFTFSRKKKFCSEDCSKRYFAEDIKSKRASGQLKTTRKEYKKQCKNCKREFTTKVNKTKYCSLSFAAANNPQNKRKNFEIYRGKERLTDWNYRNWRKQVFERDNYTCNCCGYSKGRILEAHHLDGWNVNIDARYEVSNGVTLCKKCHVEFHNTYRYGKNTKDQYLEFLNMKGWCLYAHTNETNSLNQGRR